MRSPFFNCRVEHVAECSPLPPCYLPQRPCRPTFDPAHRALVAARPVPQAHSRAGSSSDPAQILLPLFDWFLGWISAGVIVAKASAGVRRVFLAFLPNLETAQPTRHSRVPRNRTL